MTRARIPVKPSGPIALGVCCYHDASVAVCSPEGILFSVQEERLSRLKHHYGFPYKAVELALQYCGLKAKDIDCVAFGGEKIAFPKHRNSHSVGADGGMRPLTLPGLDAFMERVLARRTRKLRKTAVAWGEFSTRHWIEAQDFMAGLRLLDPRITHFGVAHHRAHAASAFRLSGLSDACVVTMDGKGDKLSATIYRGSADGELKLLRSTSAVNSLGSFYQAATEALGFVPVDGEYKTMGLAALGGPNGGNPFEGSVSVDDGRFRSARPWSFRNFNLHNPDKRVSNPLSSVAQTVEFQKILERMPPERFAFYAQEHCEKNMVAYMRDALRLTGVRHVAAAGGVMLNVKANTLIADQVKPDSYFIFPDSADSGLAAGAAMEALYQRGHLRAPVRYGDPYLGHHYEAEEIEAAVEGHRKAHGLRVRPGPVEVIAERLAEGKVIGTFQGRMEVGPRALGNRSVLADPRHAKVKDRINLLLKGREPFVPFAPCLLEDEAAKYWDGPTDYRYMTFAVRASEYAKSKVPGVVHVDGTMRPQVASEVWNPWLCRLLRAFRGKSGVGVLINTSFNRHGVPIVGSPADALDHLVKGWVDGLSLGEWYVERETAP